MTFEVCKEKGGKYYVRRSDSKTPETGTFRKTKKDALKVAAAMEGMTLKEYMKERKVQTNGI